MTISDPSNSRREAFRIAVSKKHPNEEDIAEALRRVRNVVDYAHANIPGGYGHVWDELRGVARILDGSPSKGELSILLEDDDA